MFKSKEAVWIQMIRNGTRTATRAFVLCAGLVAAPIYAASSFEEILVDTYNGKINDAAGNALTDDTLTYSYTVSRAEIGWDDGAFTFAATIKDGDARLKGVAGLERKNSGLLGKLEEALSEEITETFHFAGEVRAKVRPIVTAEGLEFESKVVVDMSEAKVRLVGKAITISMRSFLEDELTDILNREVQRGLNNFSIDQFFP